MDAALEKEEENIEEIEELKVRQLIGRDRLLQREIYPRVRKGVSFVLSGQRGIGKTDLMIWAYSNYTKTDKLYISCHETHGEIVKKIAKKQGIIVAKKSISALEKEVMKGSELTLFIDDIEKMKPKQAFFFTAWNGWNRIYMAGVEPYREEAKKILWGKQKLKVVPVSKQDRPALGKHVVEKLGCLIPADTIAQESKGIPGRAWAIGKGEFIQEDDERVQGEEVNIAPVMLLMVAGIMVVRYIGMGTGQKDLYILGGLGMAAAYILKQVIRIIS